MRRLHLRLYLAIVGTLLAFLLCSIVVWHHAATPLTAVPGVETAANLGARLLDGHPGTEGIAAEITAALARQLHADVELDMTAPPFSSIQAGNKFYFTDAQRAEPGWHVVGGPVYCTRLADGRVLLVHPRQRLMLHGLHVALVLGTIAALLALLTYPITRGITARLGRLKLGVQQFGEGDLAVRVPVEGRDEVAALATSFNESATRVEQLVRANQQLLANCSHELRTPLARMRLAIERRTGENSEADAELKRNIAELDVLIGELLLSSRLEAAKHPERVETVDLLGLAAEEAAHFDREVTGSATTVAGDPALLRRLIRNLIENARIHAGGASEIRVSRNAGGAQLVVEDAGPGIAPEDRERIFEPFYRHQQGAQTGGTGLGLSIVRQIARLHGGDVAYAAREGGGSRFIVTIPP
jgi:signal transduction histidine kinase